MDMIVEPGSFFRHFFHYESKIEAMEELNDFKKWNQITSKIFSLGKPKGLPKRGLLQTAATAHISGPIYGTFFCSGSWKPGSFDFLWQAALVLIGLI